MMHPHPMMHTHYGYGHDEQTKVVAHDHLCGSPDDHSHPDQFLAIYADTEGAPGARYEAVLLGRHPARG